MGERTSTAPPGWYPDPTGRQGYRYWDGALWTPWSVQADGVVRATSLATSPEGSRQKRQWGRGRRLAVALPGLAAPLLIALRSIGELYAALASVPPELRDAQLLGGASAHTQILIAGLDLAMAGVICLALLWVTLPRRLSVRAGLAAMLLTLVPFGVALSLWALGIGALPNAVLAVSLAFVPGIALVRLCLTPGPSIRDDGEIHHDGVIARAALAPRGLLGALLAVPGLLGPALIAGCGILCATTRWSYWAALSPGPDGGWLARGGLVMTGPARWLAPALVAAGLVSCVALVAVAAPHRFNGRGVGGAVVVLGLSVFLLVVSVQADGLGPNWAGYATSDGPFSSVTASWVQPQVPESQGASDITTSFWVGLDGRGSGTVEQIGTCLDGTAWYEMYPEPSRHIDMPVVVPGDVLRASVTRSGPHSFVLKLIDTTTGASFTTTRTAARAGSVSAEVIAEAPASSRTGQLPLDPFGRIRFAKCTVDGLPIGAYRPDRSDISSSRQTRETTTSALTGGGTVFTVTAAPDSPSPDTLAWRGLHQALPSPERDDGLLAVSLVWLSVLALARLFAARKSLRRA